MEILGYIAAIFIGISLGLIGGGGSILTVPVLVYLFNISPVPATAYSLFIVGITSLVGTITFIKRGEISYITAVVFSIPAFITVYITRKYAIPSIPVNIFQFGDFLFTRDLLIMTVFALMMVAASVSMIRNKREEKELGELKFNYPLIALEGIFVGFLTGMVGAGGGFLIIPALVLLANLPMKAAVGTSLLIIAVKSLIGFIGDVGTDLAIDWQLLIVLAIIAIIGIFIGSLISKYVPGKKLKPAFGWFVLLMGTYILGQEIFKIL